MSNKLYVLIGPSGSGKSTISNKLMADGITEHYSWDELRLRWYDADNYSRAFELSSLDKSFKARVGAEFHRVIKLGKNIIVDNTNLTPKRRKFFINTAKKHGYETVGIVFDVPLKILIERQTTRGDKCVPESVVIDQFNRMIWPMDNEFDIIINSTNVK